MLAYVPVAVAQQAVHVGAGVGVRRPEEDVEQDGPLAVGLPRTLQQFQGQGRDERVAGFPGTGRVEQAHRADPAPGVQAAAEGVQGVQGLLGDGGFAARPAVVPGAGGPGSGGPGTGGRLVGAGLSGVRVPAVRISRVRHLRDDAQQQVREDGQGRGVAVGRQPAQRRHRPARGRDAS